MPETPTDYVIVVFLGIVSSLIAAGLLWKLHPPGKKLSSQVAMRWFLLRSVVGLIVLLILTGIALLWTGRPVDPNAVFIGLFLLLLLFLMVLYAMSPYG